MNPTVAIIVVNFNGGAFIKDFAASLTAVTYPNWRLLLVDNASTDGSDKLLPQLFPDAQIIRNQRNLGLEPAINQALALCLEEDFEYVLLLNPDTILAPDFLDHLVASADAQTLVVPKVLTMDTGRIANHAGNFDWRGLLTNTHDGEPSAAHTTPRELNVASFSCTLIPAAAFRSVGPLDERLGMYYEDTEFCLRVRKVGFRILFQPSAVIRHKEGGSSGGGWNSPFTQYYASRNRPYVMRKHSDTKAYLRFSAYYLTTRLLWIGVDVGRRNWPLLRAHLLGLRDFYLGRMGMTYVPSDLNSS